ncbi:YbaB/EbfC family nucleoid-associated protein [Patulibacter sp. SYSU D01012]|uniref:YbaB/EbfC family nucleoid-associated protein n=1 Tax=Patulibacter sp. SYSU D01012 TaxID=2817381 RepID=UPI001B317DAE|nr:YbaB/EbfC family nucleoid-associated protein [Patulibacter sp. SYSU D01012]
MRQPNVQQMMKQVQKMQQTMAAEQEKLKDEELEVTAGGGMVTVKITGALEVRSVTIDPEAIDPEDAELLQDTVTAAVNQAIRESQELAEKRLGGLTGGMDLGALGLGGMGL